MENEWLIKWFKLCNIRGIGPRKIIKLLNYFENLDVVWDASSEELLQSLIFKEQMIPEWNKLKKASDQNFEKIIVECEQNHISIVPIISEKYPLKLKLIPNPPVNLFLQGNLELLQMTKIAVVGSRQSDENSKKWTFNQSINIVKSGMVVVSGGAKGIDHEAHKGALDASGKTICVMGPGLLRLYPEEHLQLFEEIRKKGLLISENLPSFSGSKYALLQRNRITSGISDALVAITGTSGHGVMTQLRHAYEQRIPIFCPKIELGFHPFEGIINVMDKYKIVQIDNINPVLEKIYNMPSFLKRKQTTLI